MQCQESYSRALGTLVLHYRKFFLQMVPVHVDLEIFLQKCVNSQLHMANHHGAVTDHYPNKSGNKESSGSLLKGSVLVSCNGKTLPNLVSIRSK